MSDIRDKILTGRQISTSIVGPIIFNYVTSFLLIMDDKVLVIEEPEESMNSLQHVVFAKYLERVVRKSMENTGKNACMVITTHSPYIEFSFSDNVSIKSLKFDHD